MNSTTLAPVRKSITVARDVEDSFRLFTQDISSWWPLHLHSIGGERVVAAVIEPRAGGRVYERWDDGSEREWGEVLTWEPPSRFVLSWWPGHEPSEATELEISFTAEGAGTRLHLEHRNWERLGDLAGRTRASYDGGWVKTLDLYAVAAG